MFGLTISDQKPLVKIEMIFVLYLWINVGNINLGYDENQFISNTVQERETKTEIVQAVRCHVLWLLIYQFIKPFLSKLSIIEEYGAFKRINNLSMASWLIKDILIDKHYENVPI